MISATSETFEQLFGCLKIDVTRCVSCKTLVNYGLRIGNEFFNADAVILNRMQTEHAVAEILERSACDNRNLLVRRIFRVNRT